MGRRSLASLAALAVVVAIVLATQTPVAGQTAGLFAGETTVSVGDNEAFLSRYDEQGTALWTREFGSSTLGDDNATGVTTDQT